MNDRKIFIYNMIFSPNKAIEYSLSNREDEHLGTALLVLFLGVFINLISKAVISFNRDIFSLYISVGGIIHFFNALGGLILFCAVIFFLRSFTLKENGNNLLSNKIHTQIFFKLMCFSFLPYFFTPVTGLLGLYLNLHDASFINSLLKVLISGWVIFLQVLIIKKMFNLKLFHSIVLFLTPFIIYYIFIIIKVLDTAVYFISKLL